MTSPVDLSLDRIRRFAKGLEGFHPNLKLVSVYELTNGLHVAVGGKDDLLLPGDGELPSRFNRLKSAYRGSLMAARANAMRTAAATASGDWPLWLAAVPRIVNDWLDWTGTRDKFLAQTQKRRAPGALAEGDDMRIQASKEGWQMQLSGYFGLGEFMADLHLDEHGSFRFLNHAIIGVGHEAPETICATLSARLASNVVVNASEVFDHPLFTLRNHSIAKLFNRSGDLVVELVPRSEDARTRTACCHECRADGC